MAYAGKGSIYRENDARDGAAELRAQAKMAQEFVNNEDRYDEWEDWYYQNYERGGYDNEPTYLVDLDDEVIKRAPRPKQFIVKAVEKAIEYDRHAKRLEYWAGVLYDHPISYEYLRRYHEAYENRTMHWRLRDAMECGFEPEWLIILENSAASARKDSKEWLARAGNFGPNKTIPKPEGHREHSLFFENGYGLSTRLDLLKSIERITHRQTHETEDGDIKLSPRLDEYNALLHNDGTTIGDLVKFYEKLCTAEAEKLNADAEELEGFLEDVKSGKTTGRSYDQMIDDGDIDWFGDTSGKRR